MAFAIDRLRPVAALESCPAASEARGRVHVIPAGSAVAGAQGPAGEQSARSGSERMPEVSPRRRPQQPHSAVCEGDPARRLLRDLKPVSLTRNAADRRTV